MVSKVAAVDEFRLLSLIAPCITVSDCFTLFYRQ